MLLYFFKCLLKSRLNLARKSRLEQLVSSKTFYSVFLVCITKYCHKTTGREVEWDINGAEWIWCTMLWNYVPTVVKSQIKQWLHFQKLNCLQKAECTILILKYFSCNDLRPKVELIFWIEMEIFSKKSLSLHVTTKVFLKF